MGPEPMEPETTDPEPLLFETCTAITNDSVAGALTVILPANFESGSQLRLDVTPQADITFFDQSTGELQLAANGSRLPQVIQYSLLDGEQNVIERRTHTVVVSDLRIMPLGDSITQGIDFFDGVNDLPVIEQRIGYRLALYNALTTEGISFDFVGQAGQRAGAGAGLPDPDNNGYPGVGVDFIDNVLAAILEENRPDVILMMIGTNFTPASASDITAIVDQALTWSESNHPVAFFVSTLVPKRDPALQQIVDQFNADLRLRVQQRDSDTVFLVEQALALGEADISAEDLGIHPNPSGYQKMSDTWMSALQTSGVLASCSG